MLNIRLNSRALTCAGLAVLLCYAPADLHADAVLLKSGENISGRITGETATSVVIDTPGGRFTFPRERVASISRESAETNKLRDLQVLFQRGHIDVGVHSYRQDGLSDTMSADLFLQILRDEIPATAGAANTTSETAQYLSGILKKSTTPPPELLLFVSALCMDHGLADDALDLLAKLQQSGVNRLNWPDRTVSLLLNRIADISILQNEGRVLGLTAEISARLNPAGSEGSTEHLATYNRIESLIRRNQLLEASASFRPEMFLYRADIFIPLAERLVTAILAGPETKASLAMLQSARVTLVPYIREDLRLRAMKALVNRLVASGDDAGAQQIVDALAETSPDLAATLHHLLDFRKQESEIAADDPIEMYKLAAWGRKMGLLEESRGVFVKLRNDPRFTETANLQLKLIEQSQAQQTIDGLKVLYSRSQVDELKTQARDFLATSPPEEFAQQARDLIGLADYLEWISQRSSHDKAEAEFQQAERFANRREFDMALMHLNRIQVDQASTEAAKKADKLRDRIMLELRREQIRKAASEQ